MPPVCDIGLEATASCGAKAIGKCLCTWNWKGNRIAVGAVPARALSPRTLPTARSASKFLWLPSLLQIETRRFECRACGRSFLPETPGLRPWKRSTEPWRQKVYIQHHEGICASALARLMKLGSATVERIYGEFTSRKARERLSLQCPRVLGIHEHTLHKGQRFATTFCDLKNHRVFDIVAGRSPSICAPFWPLSKAETRFAWFASIFPVPTAP